MTNGGTSSDERVLLVEGRDDMHVVRHLSQANSPMPTFGIRTKYGVSELLSSIRGEILAEGRIAVGILVDANDKPQSRWEAVASRLQAAGVAPPATLTPGGTIINCRPRIGVWLMPDNGAPGELENFIANMIPSGDPVWPLSETYIDGIPESARKFAPKKILRAKVHAWLAARESPRPMGLAIGTGDLNVSGTDTQRFVNWLRKVFA